MKDPVKRSSNWENIFAKDASDKGLLSTIDKELLNSTIKKTIKKGMK